MGKNARLSEPIAYRLETGAGYNRAVDFVRQYILEERKRKDFFWFGSIALASKEECNPLQAADILAYESWREVCDSNVPDCPGRPIRESGRFLWEKHTHKYMRLCIDKEWFEAHTSARGFIV